MDYEYVRRLGERQNYEFDYLVFIGRFQPFHKGHFEVAQVALQKSQNLIFVIGSHKQPRSTRNPFNSIERLGIIGTALRDPMRPPGRVQYILQEDHPYNEDKWLSEIRAAVNAKTNSPWRADGIRIGLIGYGKDHSSYYLNKFPTWKSVNVIPTQPMNATDIRDGLFLGGRDF